MAPNSNQIYDVMEQKGWHTITSKQLSGLEYNLIIVDEFVNPSFDLTEEEKEMLDSTFTKNTKKRRP